MDKILESICSNLSAIFRHIVPGAFALGIAWISHPNWFCWFKISDSAHLWLLATIALIIGNVLYVAHKNSVHLVIDVCAWKWADLTSKTSSDTENVVITKTSGYTETVGNMALAYHRAFEPTLQKFIRLRNSQIILMGISGELMIVGGLWKDSCSWSEHVARPLVAVGIIVLIFAVIAQLLSFRLERFLGLQ